MLKLFESASRQTVAVFPGSLKPPHIGHWATIEHYVDIADKVVVIISKPSAKSARETNIGTTISPEQSKSILEIFKKSYGFKSVEIIIADHPSPVKSAYDYVETLDGVDVIFGSSTDSDDLKRWKTVDAYMKKHNPSITVIDPKTTAVKRQASAGDLRKQIDNLDAYKSVMPKKLSDKDIKKVYDILNKE